MELTMDELFHTEDCGISLICRCCRAQVCEQRLSRADRMRVRRELWSDYSQTRQSFPMKSWRRRSKNVLGYFAPGILKRFARWALTGQENGAANPSKKSADTTRWTTS
jgi:hypothetical protein